MGRAAAAWRANAASSAVARPLVALWRRLDTIATRLSVRFVTGLALVAATVFALVRSWRIGGAGAFVVAGDLYTDPLTVRGGIPVRPGGGFDGQFFYRLAGDPFTVGMGRVDGISFDYKVRGGRILYPALAWVASFGGRGSLLPLAMIVVNVIAVAALAWVAAQLAVDHGRAPVWGLLIAGYWGFGIVLGRDLAELVAAAAVFAAVLLVGRSRLVWAGVAAAAAVLTREQAVVVVAGLCIGVLIAERRRGTWPRALRAMVVVAAPAAVCFVVWQAVVASVVGELPALSSSVNTTFPFADLPRAASGWFDEFRDGLNSSHLISLGASLALMCFVALAWLAVSAVTSDGLRAAWAVRPWEPMVALGGLVVFACSSYAVLENPADFRQSYELAGGSWLVLWSGGPTRRRLALLVVLPITAATLAFRCLHI